LHLGKKAARVVLQQLIATTERFQNACSVVRAQSVIVCSVIDSARLANLERDRVEAYGQEAGGGNGKFKRARPLGRENITAFTVRDGRGLHTRTPVAEGDGGVTGIDNPATGNTRL